jgi:low molecular weight protein-tyrosine phosphatase
MIRHRVVHPETSAEFQVAFLCSGNRFRSPLAAALLTEATAGLPVRVTSLGTLDIGPMSVLPEALEEAAKLGIDLSAHRAVRLLGEDLSALDLVLGFERLHVATAVVEAHARRERTFTLPELVGLLADVPTPPNDEPVERACLAVAAAHEARPPSHVLPPELADPLGRPRRVQRETAVRLHELVGRLASGLFGL